MNQTIVSLLLVLLAAVACNAFTPVTGPARVGTSLKFENAYKRGGKTAWQFEQETMYIDPKAAPKDAPKKAAAKKEQSTSAPTKMTLKKFFTLPKL